MQVHALSGKSDPSCQDYATQLLAQGFVISRLNYCSALLAGFPASMTKPQQMIQNLAAHLVFNQPKRTNVTPLLISLHWLLVEARIKFKVLMLDFFGTAPPYFNSTLNRSRQLWSMNEWHLVVSSERGKESLWEHHIFQKAAHPTTLNKCI